MNDDPDNTPDHIEQFRQPLARLVKSRKAFYISGFDPRGEKYYHRVYRKESQKQSLVSGDAITVGPCEEITPQVAKWEVECSSDSHTTQTSYEFLIWKDIILQHWPKAGFKMSKETLVTYYRFLVQGVLFNTLKDSWPYLITAIYPLCYLLIILVGAILSGYVGFKSISTMFPEQVTLGFFASFGIAVHIVQQGWKYEGKFKITWVLRAAAFLDKLSRQATPEMDERIELFAARIVNALKDPQYDEILVIGHSSGAIIAVSTIARVIRQCRLEALDYARLSLLTLGQAIPFVSYQADSYLRKDLQDIAQSSLNWLDITAPPDGASYALVDIYQLLKIDCDPNASGKPKVLSARFFKMLDHAEYRSLKKDRFKLHFQYLMAGTQKIDYDYFQITSGDKTLAARFEHLPSVTGCRKP